LKLAQFKLLLPYQKKEFSLIDTEAEVLKRLTRVLFEQGDSSLLVGNVFSHSFFFKKLLLNKFAITPIVIGVFCKKQGDTILQTWFVDYFLPLVAGLWLWMMKIVINGLHTSTWSFISFCLMAFVAPLLYITLLGTFRSEISEAVIVIRSCLVANGEK